MGAFFGWSNEYITRSAESLHPKAPGRGISQLLGVVANVRAESKRG